ncbi:MAG: hypothetical protein AABX89_05405 [Candidatus Thermoplasmatota archaeon]
MAWGTVGPILKLYTEESPVSKQPWTARRFVGFGLIVAGLTAVYVPIAVLLSSGRLAAESGGLIGRWVFGAGLPLMMLGTFLFLPQRRISAGGLGAVLAACFLFALQAFDLLPRDGLPGILLMVAGYGMLLGGLIFASQGLPGWRSPWARGGLLGQSASNPPPPGEELGPTFLGVKPTTPAQRFSLAALFALGLIAIVYLFLSGAWSPRKRSGEAFIGLVALLCSGLAVLLMRRGSKIALPLGYAGGAALGIFLLVYTVTGGFAPPEPGSTANGEYSWVILGNGTGSATLPGDVLGAFPGLAPITSGETNLLRTPPLTSRLAITLPGSTASVVGAQALVGGAWVELKVTGGGDGVWGVDDARLNATDVRLTLEDFAQADDTRVEVHVGYQVRGVTWCKRIDGGEPVCEPVKYPA